MLLKTNWLPSIRKCVFQDKPDWIPDSVYKEALAAKRHYNQDWEFWIYQVSLDYNVSMGIAEEGCIRGIKREILKMYVIYGDKIGHWFEEYLEMGNIFDKIKYPDYKLQLVDPKENVNG